MLSGIKCSASRVCQVFLLSNKTPALCYAGHNLSVLLHFWKMKGRLGKMKRIIYGQTFAQEGFSSLLRKLRDNPEIKEGEILVPPPSPGRFARVGVHRWRDTSFSFPFATTLLVAQIWWQEIRKRRLPKVFEKQPYGDQMSKVVLPPQNYPTVEF